MNLAKRPESAASILIGVMARSERSQRWPLCAFGAPLQRDGHRTKSGLYDLLQQPPPELDDDAAIPFTVMESNTATG